jgi:hypothetical protein
VKTIRKVPVIPVFVKLVPNVLEQNKIYISEEYKVAVHLCLCGCGNLSVTPLGKDGWWWDFINGEKGLTMTPSILNRNCPNLCHYVITNGIANLI